MRQNNTPVNNGGYQLPANLSKIKMLMNMMQGGGSQQQMAQMMLMNNPKFMKAMQTVNQYGGDGQAAFYAEADKLGVDPNMILNDLR